MRALKMHFNGLAEVDWAAEVTGPKLLMQRAICNTLTRQGSDRINPDRGTSLDARLPLLGSYNLLAIQHELNFASASVRRTMAAPVTTATEDTLVGFDIIMTGMTDGRPDTRLKLVAGDGTTIGTTTAL